MKLYADQCGSAVYCGETGTMLCECPDPRRRIGEWRMGARLPRDAEAIAAAGEAYRQVAARYGWKLRNQAEIDEVTRRYA